MEVARLPEIVQMVLNMIYAIDDNLYGYNFLMLFWSQQSDNLISTKTRK